MGFSLFKSETVQESKITAWFNVVKFVLFLSMIGLAIYGGRVLLETQRLNKELKDELKDINSKITVIEEERQKYKKEAESKEKEIKKHEENYASITDKYDKLRDDLIDELRRNGELTETIARLSFSPPTPIHYAQPVAVSASPVLNKQQDTFFTKRDYIAYKDTDGTLSFPLEYANKLKFEFLDKEECFEQRDNLHQQIADRDALIATLKKQINTYEEELVARKAKEEKLQERIHLLQREVDNQKIKKWTYILVGLLGGYAVSQ